MPPMMALVIITINVSWDWGEIMRDIIESGIIFCHVDKRKQIGHLESAITDGNQKWAGAAPSLINSPRAIIAVAGVWAMISSGLWVVVVVIIRIRAEPIAWARKYFVAA